jgi:YVTN family beta-propeller protein
MKALGAAVVVAVIAGLMPSPDAVHAPVAGPYRKLTEISIGGEGGWDYLSVDAAARRLYVSHATRVVVVDIEKNSIVGEIAPTPGVHGIALAPDLERGFVSNGREGTVSIVDLKTLETIGTVKTGENPDAILYDGVHHEVYAFNGRGKSATVFDGKTAEVRPTIPLPGKPEFAVLTRRRGGSTSTSRTRASSSRSIPRRTPWSRPGRSPRERRPPGWRSTRRTTGSSSAAATSSC